MKVQNKEIKVEKNRHAIDVKSFMKYTINNFNLGLMAHG